MATSAVDIVLPVYNEERDLVPSVRRLHAYLEDRFPFPATITIVDSAVVIRPRPIARLADAPYVAWRPSSTS